jgi:hypothetical protein
VLNSNRHCMNDVAAQSNVDNTRTMYIRIGIYKLL